jgi:hypothetical protein
MTCPRSVRYLAGILVLLGVNAVGALLITASRGEAPMIAPQLLRLSPNATWSILGALIVAYGASALFAAYCLHKRGTAARRAYMVFSGVVLAYLAAFRLLILVPAPWTFFLLFVLFFSLLLYLGWRVVRSHFPEGTADAP